MCALSPRFSWTTSTAPLGAAAVARTPISSLLGPGKRISPSAAGGVAGATVDPGATVGSVGSVGAVDPGAAVVGDVGVAGLDAGDVGVAGLDAGDVVAPSPSSLAQAASSAAAAGAPTPRSINRPNASRLL